VLSDENVRSIGQTLAHIEQAAGSLPETMADARALATELREISSSTLELTNRLNQTLGKAQPDLEATLANARIASANLARTADSLDRLLNQNEGGLGKAAGASIAELQQLVIDARSASNEVRELARTLRERPSSVLFEPQAAGVEIPR
jgi:ABC-type transporter Mla subunit MlaD